MGKRPPERRNPRRTGRPLPKAHRTVRTSLVTPYVQRDHGVKLHILGPPSSIRWTGGSRRQVQGPFGRNYVSKPLGAVNQDRSGGPGNREPFHAALEVGAQVG